MKKSNFFILLCMLAASGIMWCLRISAQETDKGYEVTDAENRTVSGSSAGEAAEIFMEEAFPLNIDREAAADESYYQGLIYYCNCYQYECEIAYLQQYLAYTKLQADARRAMYELGETTQADWKSYEAQQASVSAQLQVAENKRDYNRLFLEENMLDFSDYQIDEKKDVRETEYYIQQYPTKSHMLMAEYVTDYNNALVLSDAKKAELEAVTMQLDAARKLYDAGEISMLALSEEETELARVQYELQQYYAQMSRAYANLKLCCG